MDAKLSYAAYLDNYLVEVPFIAYSLLSFS